MDRTTRTIGLMLKNRNKAVFFSLLLSAGMMVHAVSAIGQTSVDPDTEWILREIADDSLHTNPYYSHWQAPAKILYWPKDIGYRIETPGGSYDPLMRIKGKLIYQLENTGRLYQISKSGAGISFTRLDETFYTGYNFGAFTFHFRDTIWSFGGYGFWQGNGHLRYYSPGVKGWEIMPVNKKVPHMFRNHNNYLDLATGKLYVPSEKLVDDGIRKPMVLSGTIKDTLRIMVLDLNSKNWSVAGLAQETLSPPHPGINLPWGKLGIYGPKSDYKTFCLDYRNNQVLTLRDRNLGIRMFDHFFPDRNSLKVPFRTLSFFHNDTLHIINSNRNHFRIRLTREDFIETGKQIYTPEKPSRINWAILAWLALGSGLITFTAGLVLIFRSKRLVNDLQSAGDFTATEEQLLRALVDSGSEFLSTETVDSILQPHGKSMDSIKKKRSSVIRSINEKYSEMTADPDQLIITTRMENDRRMMRYGIDPEKEARIKKILS